MMPPPTLQSGDSVNPLQKSSKRTSRPVRATAGKKRAQPGFVDSSIIEKDMPVESCSEDEEGNPRQSRRATKRKRTPSPPPPPLDPIIYDDETENTSMLLSDDDGSLVPHRPFNITLNIPLGFQGPLDLTNIRPAIFGQIKESDIVPSERSTRRRTDSTIRTSTSPKVGIGFTDLPAELRNKVYRNLFVVDSPFDLKNPRNFCVSSAFLRTCRMVAEEGTSVLYSENAFTFDRNRHARGPFWEPVPKEIGYKDVRQFLTMIGMR